MSLTRTGLKALEMPPHPTRRRRARAGYDDCPSSIGQGVPGHGTFVTNTFLALRVTFLGDPVTAWDPDNAIGYQVELYSTTASVSVGWDHFCAGADGRPLGCGMRYTSGVASARELRPRLQCAVPLRTPLVAAPVLRTPLYDRPFAPSLRLPLQVFRGFALAPLVGSSPTDFTGGRAGTFSPLTNQPARAMDSCANSLTHISNTGKTSVKAKWVPPAAGTGTVTIWAVVVECRYACSNNYNVKLVLPELAAAPSDTASATASASASESGTPTPSVTRTGTGTPSRSGSPTGSRSGSCSETPPPSGTGTGTPSASGSGTGTGSASQTPSNTGSPSATGTASLSTGASASNTPTPSATASGTGSGTGSLSATPSSSVSVTASGTGSGTQTRSGSVTASPLPTVSSTASASGSESPPPPSPTRSPSRSSSRLPSPSATASPSRSPAAACTRVGFCSGRGTCTANTTAGTCVCDVGYAGSACSACAAGFGGSAGSGCAPSTIHEDVSTVTAHVTLRLDADFATTAGADGSATRAAFLASLYADLTSTLGLPRSRLNVSGLRAGSVIASVSILPPPATGTGSGGSGSSSDTTSAAAAALMLSALVANTSSPLYSGAVTHLLSASAAATFEFVAATGTDGFTFQAALGAGLTLLWRIQGASLVARLDYSGAVGSNTWFAVGLASSASMLGADTVVFQPGATPQVGQYVTNDRTVGGVAAVPAASMTLTNTSVRSLGGGAVSLSFTRPLAAGGYAGARAVGIDGPSLLVYAVGGQDHTSLSHHDGGNGVASVDFRTGGVTAVEPAGATLRVAHGALMFVSWGVLLPLGAALARFAKTVRPTTGPAAFWFLCHRLVQTVGLCVAIAGLAVAIAMVAPGPHFSGVHHVCGLVAMVLGLLQPLNAVFRPHPPAKGAPRSTARLLWEVLHKGSGYCALLLAVATIFLGLKQIGASLDLSIAYGALVAAAGCAWLWREAVRRSAARGSAVISAAPPGLEQQRRARVGVARSGNSASTTLELPQEPAVTQVLAAHQRSALRQATARYAVAPRPSPRGRDGADAAAASPPLPSGRREVEAVPLRTRSLRQGADAGAAAASSSPRALTPSGAVAGAAARTRSKPAW